MSVVQESKKYMSTIAKCVDAAVTAMGADDAAKAMEVITEASRAAGVVLEHGSNG